MSLEPICAYVYINGEIILSSSANAIFRSDKTKLILLNPTMALSDIITTIQSSIRDDDVTPIITTLWYHCLYTNSMVMLSIGQFKLLVKRVFGACSIHLQTWKV